MTIADILDGTHDPGVDPDPSLANWTDFAGEGMLRGADGARHAVTVRHRVLKSPATDALRHVLVLFQGIPGVEPAWRALTDPITGLPHRDVVSERFMTAQQMAMRNGRRVALLWMDIDHFQSVNDLIGHDGGDEFLRHVADRMSSAVGDAALLCRIVGGEFLAVITDVDSAARITELIERLKAALDVPFVVHDEAFSRTVSIGVALYPDDGADFVELARKADVAKQAAQRGGPNRVLFHASALTDDFEQRRVLERALAGAIDRDEIYLCYQPQVDLQTGRIVGLEALARWTWPGHGEIPPGVFIPIAEESGLIVELGAKVYRLASEQASAWNSAGIAVPVSVNLSQVEIARGGADLRILEIIEQSGLPPELLTVEITESGLIDETSRTETTIANLRESSVSLIIDDFLTGYSNFAYIRRFRASHLKIDRSFVAGIDSNPENAAIVRAAVQMATALGIVTVAEGVENEQEAAELRALGCGCAQGYLFARPMPAEETEVLLKRGVITVAPPNG